MSAIADAARGRALDHVVMPVESLAAIRAWFEALGFIVAPEAVHPFGTKNACVFFADGSYVEPLAIADAALAASEAAGGNTFVARDRAFRANRREPGFSGIALRSGDSAADLQAFRGAGIGEGELFQFSRSFQGPDGTMRDLTFRLAFAGDPRAPGLFFFACQPLAGPADRSALIGHANTVRGVSRLVLSASDPARFAAFLEAALGCPAGAGGSGDLSLTPGGAAIDVLTPASLLALYDHEPGEGPDLVFEGLVLSASDLSPIRRAAEMAGVPAAEHAERLVLTLPEPGRGFIAFEAARPSPV